MATAHTIARRAPIYARAAVRLAIALGVLAYCVGADCVALAYSLGRQTGAAVHARNDQLAALAVRLLAPAPAPAPVATAEPEPEPTPAEPAPTLADLFRAQAAEIAASDARLYRAAGERIGTMRAILASAEPAAPAPVTVSIAPEPGAPSLAQIADCRRRMVRLERMTVAQLRDLTGARSKRLRKADLVQIALESAMA